MKKTYLKPETGTFVMGVKEMLQTVSSPKLFSSGTANTSGTETDPVMEGRERGGIFSAPDNGYNRSLW
ncbi:MAG: hypothetical protein IJP75_07485 [Bacteroidaceae bacterium]|nr:hypothetical protein [Bacteroidaceae bacterium]